jgi:hypothetical protein
MLVQIFAATAGRRRQQVVLVKRHGVRAGAGGDRGKHVAHRAEPLRVATVVHARVVERVDVLRVFVGGAVVEQVDVEIPVCLGANSLNRAGGVMQLPVAGQVD